MGQFFSKKLKLQWAIIRTPSLKVVLGAGPTSYPGWINTDIDTLDITNSASWKALFGRRRAAKLLAEHVWEHLTDTSTAQANSNCLTFLQTGGRLRLAVPDGFHPDPAYREHVRPGGTGPGADDHKILYNYKTMVGRLEQAGFQVILLEYWDEQGQFHFSDWSADDGYIDRSKRYDPRNQDGSLSYTSLIVDAVKP